MHLLPTESVSTFDDYANDIFIPYIKKQLDTNKHIDVVWDSYLPNSIKVSTGEKRGKGMRQKVEARNTIPRNWLNFLRNAANNLFFFRKSLN